MNQRRARDAALAAAAIAVTLLAMLHLATPAIPFAPLALTQGLVRLVPGDVATFFIELLGHVALPLAALATAAAFLAAGRELGRLLPLLARATRGNEAAALAVALLPLWAAWVWLAPHDRVAVIGRGMFALLTAPSVAIGAVVGTRAVRQRSPGPDRVPDPSRRHALRWLAVGIGGMVAGGAGTLLRRRPDPGARMLVVPDLSAATTPSPTAADRAFRAIDGLTPRITALEDFYVVDEAIVDPDVDPAAWRLEVLGRVERPLSLSYDELTSMPVVERFRTLECISNPVGGDLISTARWAGVPLASILERAGVRPGAVEVVFRSADGYSDSLSIDVAADPETLIAIGMNGHVLPRAHGFPARLLSEGTYGMKNPKWLTRIELVELPYQGYWERRGWSKAAIVKTGVRIDVPVTGDTVTGTVDVAGVAFAGDRDISRVEVSDDGRAWTAAALETPPSTSTWARWRLVWEPRTTGPVTLFARAYDGDGGLQTARTAEPHPDGASGYALARVTVA